MRKDSAGATFVEAMTVLAISAAMAAGAFKLYSDAMDGKTQLELATQMAEIRDAMNNAWRGRPWGNESESARALKLGKMGVRLDTPWNTPVRILTTNGIPGVKKLIKPSFGIELSGLSAKQCIFAAGTFSKDADCLAVNSDVSSASDCKVGVKAEAACGASENNRVVMWYRKE